MKRVFEHPVRVGWLATLVIFGLAAWAGYSEYCIDGRCTTKFAVLSNSRPNEVGDTLAGFAGSLAFVWIIVTVWLQSKEMNQQVAGLRDTIEVQKKLLKMQEKELRREVQSMNDRIVDELWELLKRRVKMERLKSSSFQNGSYSQQVAKQIQIDRTEQEILESISCLDPHNDAPVEMYDEEFFSDLQTILFRIDTKKKKCGKPKRIGLSTYCLAEASTQLSYFQGYCTSELSSADEDRPVQLTPKKKRQKDRSSDAPTD